MRASLSVLSLFLLCTLQNNSFIQVEFYMHEIIYNVVCINHVVKYMGSFLFICQLEDIFSYVPASLMILYACPKLVL